jgi:hypothetical protein
MLSFVISVTYLSFTPLFFALRKAFFRAKKSIAKDGLV